MLEYSTFAIKNNTLSHAYIITGAINSSTPFAEQFAKAILCSNPNDGSACHICRNCLLFGAKNHPDAVFITNDKKTIGIEKIRTDIIDRVYAKPYIAEKKVFIIQNAHLLTIAAQNSLLKTLEEGPKYAIFFLLAEDESSLLKTVVSRAVVLSVDSSTTTDAETDMHEFVNNLSTTLQTASIAQKFEIARKIDEKKAYINQILDRLLEFYKNKMLENNEIEKYIKNSKKIENARNSLKHNTNFLLTVEVLLLELDG